MAELQIRLAQGDDADRISQLLRQLGYETAPAEIEALLSKSLEGKDEVYLAALEGRVVALMSLIFFDYFPSAEKLSRITSIVVDEALRGSAIGTQMIEHAKARALVQGCHRLEVTTSLRRHQTQRFYEGNGFTRSSYRYVQEIRQPLF